MHEFYLAEVARRILLRVRMDSSAARGIFGRTGPGRIRHLHTRYLWVQEKVRRKELSTDSVKGDENEADLGTKILTGERTRFLSLKIGLGPAQHDKGGFGSQARQAVGKDHVVCLPWSDAP